MTISAGTVELEGRLAIPPRARGIVLFAHGSGSGRYSPRNQFVARELETHGLATLLFDLLTPAEQRRDEPEGDLRFDIDLLAERVVSVADRVHEASATRTLPMGLFGASTGAAAALVAAAQRPDTIAAVVSRGGRPDLAGGYLRSVVAPTLLIVGGADLTVLGLNRAALTRLAGPKELAVVAGATHLFEEAGALEQVSDLAVRWFSRHFPVVQETAAPQL